jgi:mono/diheme cytochrome c family protein
VKRYLNSLGIGAISIVCAGLIGTIYVSVASNRQINRRYQPAVASITIPSDSATIARGRHLARAVLKCTDCHGEDLGGTALTTAAAFGQIAAPNITRGQGGKGSVYTDEDLIRLIRHGVKRDGRAAVIMPVEAYRFLSDDDLAAVIAHVRDVPPVDKEWPPVTYGVLARVLIAAGKLPVFAAATIDHRRSEVAPRTLPDTTVEYGRYLSRISGCQGCHNPAMSGGPIAGGAPASPPASNLTPTGIDVYTEEDFVRVLRQGTGLGGRVISDFMPWKTTARLTDGEIHAIWLYLITLPPKEMGQP